MASTNFMCLLFGLTFFISLSYSTPIRLELSPNPNLISSQNPNEFISNIAKSTLKRAYHLKYRNKNPSNLTSTQLFPQSKGDYSILLTIGTPPQKIPAFFDTGSSLVWVPCTSHYTCFNCTRHNETITTFLPNNSTSKRSVTCSDKKCRWLDQPNVQSSCPTCTRALPAGGCNNPCSYIQAYGAGDTYGNAIFENLNLGNKIAPDFLVGCSYLSDIMPEGIVGFGRNPMSLPNQLNLNKFSHCFVSHKFDDSLESSSLILGDPDTIPGVNYTPLLKNPQTLPFNQYYYVNLEKITVGTKIIKTPLDIHGPDPNGNGGTIIDSGSTLTALSSSVFDSIMERFVDLMTHAQQNRVGLIQFSVGNVVCIDVTGLRKAPVFPEVVFYFKGGVKMDLTVDNYIKGGENILCLPFVNTTFGVGQGGSGPAIIVGNYQQQNYYIEYDLKNERLGLKKQNCESRY